MSEDRAPSPERVELMLDFTDALEIIDQVRRQLRELHGRTILTDPDTGTNKANRASAAERSRIMLRAQDMLDVAKAEVNVQYWRARGYDDPRD